MPFERISTRTAVLRPDNDQIDLSVEHILRSTLGDRNVRTSKDSEDKIVSISVPRDAFRIAVKNSGDLRAIIRAGEVQVQEIASRGLIIRRMVASEPVPGSVYVQEVKRGGANAPISENSRSQAQWLSDLRERFSDWGQIKIPIIVLAGMSAVTLWGAYKLKNTAEKIVDDYSRDNAKMIESEKGLAEVVRKRAGLPPQTAPAVTVQDAAATHKPATRRSG